MIGISQANHEENEQEIKETLRSQSVRVMISTHNQKHYAPDQEAEIKAFGIVASQQTDEKVERSSNIYLCLVEIFSTHDKVKWGEMENSHTEVMKQTTLTNRKTWWWLWKRTTTPAVIIEPE